MILQDALKLSTALDDMVLSAAATISPEYVSILSPMTRQTFAPMDVIMTSSSFGSYNTSDVKIFMEDIGMSL